MHRSTEKRWKNASGMKRREAGLQKKHWKGGKEFKKEGHWLDQENGLERGPYTSQQNGYVGDKKKNQTKQGSCNIRELVGVV